MSIQPRPCQRCKDMIPVERIEALPDTRLCVKCSQAIGGDYIVSVTRESIGKAGSLKKNYGSASLKKVRRLIDPIEPRDE
jgi:DksA/TraR C4-type zinc finger protein